MIDKAFELAGKDGFVYIGITNDEMIEKKKYGIPLEKRINNLKSYLKSKDYKHNASIEVIYDEFDKATTGEYDVIIVSPETIKNGEKLNKIRIKNGKKPVKLIQIPHVLAEDNKPISSTRILNKEIDEEGRVLL